MLSAGLALVGALVYGGADFFGGLAARRLRSIVVTAAAAASGLAFLLIALPFVGGTWKPADLAWGALAGVFGVVAIALLYACLAIGPMSILSPLTAVISAIAPMLWGLFVNGETLSPIGYAGLAVALVAVVLVGFIPGEKVVRPSARGLLMAVGAGLAIGAFLIVIDQTSAESGLVPLVMTRLTNMAITLVIIGALIARAVRTGRTAASVLEVSGPSDRRALRPATPISSMRPRRMRHCATGSPTTRVASVVARDRLRNPGCRGERAACCSLCASATCRSCRRSPRCTRPGRSSWPRSSCGNGSPACSGRGSRSRSSRAACSRWPDAGGRGRAAAPSAAREQQHGRDDERDDAEGDEPGGEQRDRAHERGVLREPHAVLPSAAREDVVHPGLADDLQLLVRERRLVHAAVFVEPADDLAVLRRLDDRAHGHPGAVEQIGDERDARQQGARAETRPT